MAIVCGTDFSSGSADAATVAAMLAARLQEPLVLLYAMDALSEFRAEPETAEAHESLVELGRSRLPGEAARLREYGAEVEEVFVTGAPDEALVQRADRLGARLVVVSSKGHHGASGWLLGSVAERTAQTSPVPVLIVRALEPFEAWLNGKRPLRVMAGTDLSEVSDVAVRWAVWLRDVGACDLTVAHVTAGDRPASRRRPPEGEDDAGRAGALEQDLRIAVGEVPGEGELRFIVRAATGPVGKDLVDLAVEDEADLLVVGSQQRRGLEFVWHGSVSRTAIHLAPMSAACVAAAAPADRRAEPLPEVRRVMVPTDFTNLGNLAIPHAYSILPRGGSVHLVHVRRPPMFQGAEAVPDLTEQSFTARTAEQDEDARRLMALVPEEAARRGITTRFTVITSRDVVKGICTLAQRIDADVICISSAGGGSLLPALLGSVAEGVMSRSQRPVLLVRPDRSS